MKAIAIENPGPDYRLTLGRGRRNPWPGPGEVLIKVAAAGLNHADLAAGARASIRRRPARSPILGMEVSGTVAALGDGVSDCEIGDEVCALLPGGGYAEYAVASALCVLPVPDGVSTWSMRRPCPKCFSPSGPI